VPQVSPEGSGERLIENISEAENIRHLFALNASSLRTKMRSFGAFSERHFEAHCGMGSEALKDEMFSENCPK